PRTAGTVRTLPPAAWRPRAAPPRPARTWRGRRATAPSAPRGRAALWRWSRRAARRLHRQSAARPRGAEGAVARRPRQVRAGRGGAARGLHAAGGSVLTVPAVRGDRDPPRDQLPDHRHGSLGAAEGPAARSERVGEDRSQGRVEEG